MGGVFSLLMKRLTGLKVALAWDTVNCVLPTPWLGPGPLSSESLGCSSPSSCCALALLTWVAAWTRLPHRCPIPPDPLPSIPPGPLCSPRCPLAIGGGLLLQSSALMLLKLGVVPALISFCSAWVTALKTHLTSSANPPPCLLPVCPKVSLWGSSVVPAPTICSVPLPWHQHQKAESRPRAFGSLLPPWHARGFSLHGLCSELEVRDSISTFSKEVQSLFCQKF